jgi:hypothetical protein
MKIAALLAGIALTLNALIALYNLSTYFTRGTHLAPSYLAGQAAWFFAQGCMIVFFFAFHGRVKE